HAPITELQAKRSPIGPPTKASGRAKRGRPQKKCLQTVSVCVVKALSQTVSCRSIIRPRPVSGCSGTKTMIKSGKQAKIKGGLAESPSHLIHRALQLALDIYAEEAGPEGLTQRQFAVLEAVAARSGLTQTDLVKATGIDRSTLADLVARMTTKGLLERERSALDARAKAVRL